jgi:transposase
MPKLMYTRPAASERETRQIQQLARSRHAPADWIVRARIIVRSWAGLRTTAIAAELQCHPQTVRERIVRFNAEGIDGLGDRPGVGRKRRITEAERSVILALVTQSPPGRRVRQPDGTLAADDDDGAAQWTLDALTDAAHAHGIQIGRSHVRRIFQVEGARWRKPRTWATSADPEFSPKERRSSRFTPNHRLTQP